MVSVARRERSAIKDQMAHKEIQELTDPLDLRVKRVILEISDPRVNLA